MTGLGVVYNSFLHEHGSHHRIPYCQLLPFWARVSMKRGIHSTINTLDMNLQRRWGPKWYEAFQDRTMGGFYERLGHSFRPLYNGQRRLLTQCRQLSVYSALGYGGLRAHFDHIVERYYDPDTDLWIFSLDDTGQPLDKNCDLYALSFVIFMCTHYFKATGDTRAQDLAVQTVQMIDKKFRIPGIPGLMEALNENNAPIPALRRQNPHMHLLEACLFAYDTWRSDAFIVMADEMVGLFHSHFFNKDRCILHEFFDDRLQPDPSKGDLVEPGHYFEWVWLLKKHAQFKHTPALHADAVSALFHWAHMHGWDLEHGGVYDVLKPDGRVVTDTKRIWPFCEALKAYTLMLADTPHNAATPLSRQAIKDRVTLMVAVFEDKYMEERGFWTEVLNRDLTNQTNYMPGTTPYHVYFGITETKMYLDRRGPAKSLSFKTLSLWYTTRRKISDFIKTAKRLISGREQI